MAKKLTAIERDFKRSPYIFFTTKPAALKAKEQATAAGIKTRLSATSKEHDVFRWKLRKMD